jgi:hypothetical protein
MLTAVMLYGGTNSKSPNNCSASTGSEALGEEATSERTLLVRSHAHHEPLVRAVKYVTSRRGARRGGKGGLALPTSVAEPHNHLEKRHSLAEVLHESSRNEEEDTVYRLLHFSMYLHFVFLRINTLTVFSHMTITALSRAQTPRLPRL